MCNMERIGLMASEEMSFENVDGRRMPAGELKCFANVIILPGECATFLEHMLCD